MHSISGSHSVSKQNDRGSEYFEIERPGGQKLGGSFDFVTPASLLLTFGADSRSMDRATAARHEGNVNFGPTAGRSNIVVIYRVK